MSGTIQQVGVMEEFDIIAENFMNGFQSVSHQVQIVGEPDR